MKRNEFEKLFIFYTLMFLTTVYSIRQNDCNNLSSQCEKDLLTTKYIFYDVNPFEGFNLRRDVYMRIAILFNQLKRDGVKWTLVLPPWNNLPHWRSLHAGSQARLPWSYFFDLSSLQKYASVIEMFEFLEDHPNFSFDHLVILQHYRHIWNENFTWAENWDIEECQRPPTYKKEIGGLFKGSFAGYDIFSKEILCISFQGSASLLKKVIENFDGRYIAFQHAETVIHEFYGGSDYWKCRASMKFSDELIAVAINFLDTTLITKSEPEKNNSGFFVGYPFLCVHLRRRDYLSSHPLQVPSIQYAAEQIKSKLNQSNLKIVFLASDALDKEKEELALELVPYKVVHFTPSAEILNRFKDGGIAIIEQIVCSQAKYFIGTYESTFSFRIHEERELLNLDPDSTFNRLCGDSEVDCKQPTKWRKIG